MTVQFPRKPAAHHAVVVIGGGQAGLSVSSQLKKHGVEHVIFERDRIAHSWRHSRWDSFCLVTPNWQCRLPDFPYPGDEPDGFMGRDDIVSYVEAFARKIEAPVREGVAVSRVSRDPDGLFRIATSEGEVTADAVTLAVSGYHVASTPKAAEALDPSVVQLHTRDYKNADQLPDGAVLVVGSGQSGAQIAEDLQLAGRKVHLAVGSAPRCPRVYRGRDSVAWLEDLGQYDLPVDKHPKGAGVRKQANHYLTGRGGGRDIDLRAFASKGMTLHGRFAGFDGAVATFNDDLAKNLDAADEVYNGICGMIDKHIAEAGLSAPAAWRYEPVWRPDPDAPTTLDLKAAGVTSVIWATGFRSDWSFVDLPFLDEAGYPSHARGVTKVDGLYIIGLPWLYTWGSGRFVGVGRDAEHLVEALVAKLPGARSEPIRAQG